MNHAADTTVDLAADLTANHMGLRWVCDNMPGIRRTSTRAGFSYVGPRGKRLRSPADLRRIKSLAIPPAYQDVWICPWPNGHLQATGRDARGRKQYRYHPDWLARRSETKFASLARFGRGLPLLRKRIQHELSSGETPTRTRVLAAIVQLLDTAWLRIGNESYQQQNGSYGLTTLRNRHIQIEGSVLRLNFVGKSGVRQTLALDDKRLARLVRRCRELPGQHLFQYVDDSGQAHALGSADVNAWLLEITGETITAKDFRTWHASVLALQLLLDYRFESANSASPAPLPTLIATVAKRLGNTPTVCRKSYIHPAVLIHAETLTNMVAWQTLQGQRWITAPVRKRGLRLAECQLLSLLGNRRRKTVPPHIDSQAPTASRGER